MFFRRRHPAKQCRHWWQQEITPADLAEQQGWPHARRCRRCGEFEVWALSRERWISFIDFSGTVWPPIPVDRFVERLANGEHWECARRFVDSMLKEGRAYVAYTDERRAGDEPDPAVLSEAVEITGALWAKRLEDDEDE